MERVLKYLREYPAEAAKLASAVVLLVVLGLMVAKQIPYDTAAQIIKSLPIFNP